MPKPPAQLVSYPQHAGPEFRPNLCWILERVHAKGWRLARDRPQPPGSAGTHSKCGDCAGSPSITAALFHIADRWPRNGFENPSRFRQVVFLSIGPGQQILRFHRRIELQTGAETRRSPARDPRTENRICLLPPPVRRRRRPAPRAPRKATARPSTARHLRRAARELPEPTSDTSALIRAVAAGSASNRTSAATRNRTLSRTGSY